MATVPDPRQGVFETLLVLDGRPVEFAAHMERLKASLAKLFPDLPAPDLGEMDAPAKRGSLRITVMPIGKELDMRASVQTVVQRSEPAALHSLCVPGGLGAHKWADRSLLDEAQAKLPADALPLIVDDDGAVLEASRANIFAVRDGALLTPPTDGRILPGITRMRILEIAAAAGRAVRETELTHADLLVADEVFLTGSVRGVERVRSIDGTALALGGEVASDLGAELRRTWLAAKVG